jgi:hypothetical protein
LRLPGEIDLRLQSHQLGPLCHLLDKSHKITVGLRVRHGSSGSFSELECGLQIWNRGYRSTRNTL